MLLEMGDELGHGLLGDLGSLGENADAGAFVVEELKDIAVGRADLGMSALGEAVACRIAVPIRNGSREDSDG